MAAKKKVNYDLIEPSWRAGVKSLTQIRDDYFELTGVAISSTAIHKHFRRLGVPRDLSWKVDAKANAMVSEAMVKGRVSAETTETESAIISAEAKSVADIKFSHRVNIPAKTALVEKLFGEIIELTDGKLALKRILRALRDGDQEQAAKGLEKVASLPSRIQGTNNLVKAYQVLVDLERKAFNIDNERVTNGGPTGFEMMTETELTDKIAKMALRLQVFNGG